MKVIKEKDYTYLGENNGMFAFQDKYENLLFVKHVKYITLNGVVLFGGDGLAQGLHPNVFTLKNEL